MFEAHVLYLLRKYLGEYVQGLSAETLKISVWKGDVVLKDLRLKADALNSLKLPVTIKAGFIGTITLKVPWKSLGKEPVIVLIDRLFVLAHPASDGDTLKDEDRQKLFEAKLQRIEEAELATLEAKAKSTKLGNPPGANSWLGSLIGTVIGNLKITMSNVHIRYEDEMSNPGHPFCVGITLAKLAAVTTDEQGIETFDTSGALDKLCKSLQLQRLAVYHDSNESPWMLDKKWEDMSPNEWIEIFEDGVNDPASGHSRASLWALDHKYLLSPINGVLKYRRLGKEERKNLESPFEKVSLVLDDVSVTVSEAQYHDAIKLLEVISRYRTRVDVSHLRPVIPVFENPSLWWRFAFQAGLQQKKMCYSLSWDKIHHLCQLRRRYVQLYACSLQHLSDVGISEIREIEKSLDSKVILLWRLLAHAKIESVKSMEAAQQRDAKKWWWYKRGTESISAVNDNGESKVEGKERLTKEEWHAINKLLSYQMEEENTDLSVKEMQNAMKFLVNVSICQAAARIISDNNAEVVCGRFEQLGVTAKLYHQNICCDVSLKFYGLSAPEGSIAESVSSRTKVNALEASFVSSPLGENLDWRLSAMIAPCHVTVLMESYKRFLEFVKRSNDVSPIVAMETATALQMKIEQVTRKAQEQFQLVLKEQTRFMLDVDFDAPKVMIPLKTSGSDIFREIFVLDFGHFTLHTKEVQGDKQMQSLYSRFFVLGREIAAFFVGIGSDYEINTSLFKGQFSTFSFSEKADQFYSVIDRCGMSFILDRIKLPHPRLPSTRVSIQVPNLAIHVSVERYRRMLDLLSLMYDASENGGMGTNACPQSTVPCWHPPDLATNARILVWRGIGNFVAGWKPCFLVLSKHYLYAYESEASQSYQRCSSMAGRQVFEVTPASVGGSLLCLAVCIRGMDFQKALESSNTLIIEFRDPEEKFLWLKGLTQAIYKASAPPSLNLLEESRSDTTECDGPQKNIDAADLVVLGSLLESKLLIYGKVEERMHENVEEVLIVELLAAGGKVSLVSSGGDLTVKMKLNCLKIKDELRSSVFTSPEYLAFSVLKDEKYATQCTSGPVGCELSETLQEEGEIFNDALPDFTLAPDQGFYSHGPDPPPGEQTTSYAFQHCDIFDFTDGLKYEEVQLKRMGLKNEVHFEPEDADASDFVAITFLTRHRGSFQYNGIDTQMSIRLSSLEVFCNRPTLVSLIEFGYNLSMVKSVLAESTEFDSGVAQYVKDKGENEDNESSFVKGLLGHGKSRIVFYFKLDVDSVCVHLNKEDGSQLAMFVQERFQFDLKVYPTAILIDGILGNLRLCDMTLGQENNWRWLCDMQDQGIESLIKFTFQSYGVEDGDYEGYDYSLTGQLSAVRIVFLYKFVQEITSYVMELATPHGEEAVRLVDQVGGFEWLIQKHEIDGASALKLDLSLDTPIIFVPRNSKSEEYMQLDLGKLEMKNSFSWHGGGEKDPSAVHLDILHIQINGINMAVGFDGVLGNSMIHDCQGVQIQVRRSLRDIFKRVPTVNIEAKVDVLHCRLSDKEYGVILECAYANICEEPQLPPPFRGCTSNSIDSVRTFVNKVNLHSYALVSSTSFLVAIEVEHAVLELCNQIDEEFALAEITLEGLWISYRSTSFLEKDFYVTVPRFSVLDVRPSTKAEMRLMLGCDGLRQGFGHFPSSNGILSTSRIDDCCSGKDSSANIANVTNLTMLLMDYRVRSSSQSIVIRIQQPRVLVVLDFLLALGEFFVPSLRTVTRREEIMDPKNDPLSKNNNIILSSHIYEQKDDSVHLSPRRKLIVDAFGVDEFTYDGCGGTIYLTDENDMQDTSFFGVQPIIIIGHGKRLRFKSVKIENAALLKDCIYLSNGSSYFVSADDGVELVFSEVPCSKVYVLNDHQSEGSLNSFVAATNTTATMNGTQSFTFEAQVVSAELTFYDGAKHSMDHSLLGEKLLRVKFDLNIMYALKGEDTWITALLKDLTMEAGSGLVILDPVDLSGGYTYVNDKTSISIISTDIFIRLSLSVISLGLNLQNQAIEALHYGNANPIVPCTSFDRIWVACKGKCAENVTFWRPQAPPNYAILGDCVSSRSAPPSQAVMAVSNAYGRIRKPLGFQLIGYFSSFQGLEEGGILFDACDDCSIWMPVAPPGYSTLGCVVNIGKEPPPNHIVYCIRSDLVSESDFSDCILSVAPNPRTTTGFSIWRLDNAVGSFYAHAAVDHPPKINCYDLHLTLFRNPYHICFDMADEASYTSVHKESETLEKNKHTSSSSRWDVLRSISGVGDCISTPHFERIWWDKGSNVRPVSIWRPISQPGFSVLGDCITEGFEPPALGLLFKFDGSGICARPLQLMNVAHLVEKGNEEAFLWYLVPPPGYASLGCVASRTAEAPSINSFCCPRIDLVSQATVAAVPISKSSSSSGYPSWSIWRVENQACTFLARSDMKRPSNQLAYGLSNCMKPKTCENISFEMKLECFSFTVLDSLSEMMKPLFDTTITNINLATHGWLEPMNAVLIASVSASTFNPHLESWEPLLEPFDGIFKLETYESGDHLQSRAGKRFHIAAPSAINLNISAANLDTLIESIISWRKQEELDQKSMKANAAPIDPLRGSVDTDFSALEDDDFQKVIVENHLSCNIYLKRFEQDLEIITMLGHDDHVSAWIPPPLLSDKLNFGDGSMEARSYVAVNIHGSKGLPILYDGNDNSFFCAIRLVNDGGLSDQLKLFPQSARTKSIKPLVSKVNGMDKGLVKWNELFIFEIQEKGLVNLEVEVTNLASKAGKGEVIGSFSLFVGNRSGPLNRSTSLSTSFQKAENNNISSYPLKRDGLTTDDSREDLGHLLISTSYIEKKTTLNFQKEMESLKAINRNANVWIGLDRDGPWESFQSIFSSSVIPKTLNGNFFALETVMKNGKKHAIFRSLVVVVSNLDVLLQVSLCPLSILERNISHDDNLVIEEIFENQRYQPFSGWRNKWAGFYSNDPERWSTRDMSYSSKDFFEPTLPPHWEWSSAWTIEKSHFVDSDGWAYGTDYRSLSWPPKSPKSSTKSPLDFVRRRRWIRTRKQVLREEMNITRDVFAIIKPRESTAIPWKCVHENVNMCLQIRPHFENTEELYRWSYIAAEGSEYISENDHLLSPQGSLSRQITMKSRNHPRQFYSIMLNELEKKDVLFCCNPISRNKQCFWLCVGSDATAHQSESNDPIYDWIISINAPLIIESRLPCSAEFAIWERTKDGKRIERQHGILSSCGSAFIYSADVQNCIYLTLLVQGCWILEKDAVKILDPSAVDHVSSFWIINKQSNRRLRVSLERDFGGTTAAPKTVRLFVPYWIVNDTSLPLVYHVVEIEPSINDGSNSSSSKELTFAKLASKHWSKLTEDKSYGLKKTIRILEVIDDLSPTATMLSPQDYISRSGILPFQSQNAAFARVGIAVSIHQSKHYSLGISLQDLENKERVYFKVFNSDGSYYKLSAALTMTSSRTKVVHFQPQTLVINRTGQSLTLLQCGTEAIQFFRPAESPRMFPWKSTSKSEFLKLKLNGFLWSMPFSIEYEGMMCVSLKRVEGSNPMNVRIEVRSGGKKSRYELIFRLASLSSPYRIENRSLCVPINFRQVDGTDDSWRYLPPNAAAAFFWEDLHRERLLEVVADGVDPTKSQKYNIDGIFHYQPTYESDGSVKALHATVLREGKVYVIKISDWLPATKSPKILHAIGASNLCQAPEKYSNQSPSETNAELHVTIELSELGISIIDHTPEEILYLSISNLLLSYSTGLGSGVSRFTMRMHRIQIDNQLPFSPMPVLFRQQKPNSEVDYISKLSITIQSNGSFDLHVFPFLSFQVPEGSVFLINIHEPVIWRLYEMIQKIKPNRLFGAQITAASIDPIIQIGLLNISEIQFKVSLAMSPTQRPSGVLGFWLSLMTALGNTENMMVRINQRFHEGLLMRQSALISSAISNIQKDLLSHPLQLLSGVDILSNASSAFGHISKSVADLSMDKKFIEGRQRKESKGVEDIGDVIRDGGGALAKGLFRGVTGILTKPIEGAKSSGVEGFVHGVGKGLIGAAAQPVSGVLDLLSKTTEGANAVRMKIASAIISEEQLLRKRLPRVIGGDNLIRPYDEYKAQGQVILQLAECGTFLGQVDLFKVRGKFALTDAYEEHFLLPKGKIVVITHRRVLLLQQPSNIASQRKFNPIRDPCSVMWDVLWDDLVTMELTHGKKESAASSPSRLILYLRSKSAEGKENIRVIKCIRETVQALDIYASIERAMVSYGPKHSKHVEKGKVPKPYSPGGRAVHPRKNSTVLSTKEIPEEVPLCTNFGKLLPQP